MNLNTESIKITSFKRAGITISIYFFIFKENFKNLQKPSFEKTNPSGWRFLKVFQVGNLQQRFFSKVCRFLEKSWVWRYIYEGSPTSISQNKLQNLQSKLLNKLQKFYKTLLIIICKPWIIISGKQRFKLQYFLSCHFRKK